jgi:hypothetical protein
VRLIRFRVRDFRSVVDSNWIEVEWVGEAVLALGSDRHALMAMEGAADAKLGDSSFHFAVSACSGEPGRNAQLSQGSRSEADGSEGSQIRALSSGSQIVRQFVQMESWRP